MPLLCALQDVQSPPMILNSTGPELVSCRQVAERFGELLGKPVRLVGTESPVALHSCAERVFGLYGKPKVQLKEMMEMTANWVLRGGVLNGKATHFEVADGKF